VSVCMDVWWMLYSGRVSIYLYVCRYMYAVASRCLHNLSSCSVVLFCCPVLSPICLHTRHIRGYSTTSLSPCPLPNPLPIHGNQEPQELKSKIPAQLTEKHNYGASRVLTTQETTSTAIDGTITQSQVDKITETPRTNKHTDR
jgi:hypothetical protein